MRKKIVVYVYDPDGNLYQRIAQLNEYSWEIYDAYEDIWLELGFSFEGLIEHLEILQKHGCKIKIIEEVQP